MKGAFRYKCRMCGTYIDINSFDSDNLDCRSYLEYVMDHHQEIRHSIPLQRVHTCINGDIGIVDLIGIHCSEGE